MEVKMIKDSISPDGIRLSTMHLRYWRPIHSELMTHRVFSRNARSSRAVPVATLLSEEIFIPEFGINKPGMQSTEAPSPQQQAKWAAEWKELAEITRVYVKNWGEEGMHKQHANRPLEWFGWIDVLVSSTAWTNFWALRDHRMAQPELFRLAVAMRKCMGSSVPKLLQPGQWHLPYISDADLFEYDTADLLKLSTARCARLSYKPFEQGASDYDSEIARYERLVVDRPVHASPAEHQATPDYKHPMNIPRSWGQPEAHGNFYGWIQHRKLIPCEAVSEEWNV